MPASNFRIGTGSVGSITIAQSFTSNQGLSGSLQNLNDGTSYLIAGSNVTIVTGSNGAVTISSTGGGSGTPGGSNTQVQFNDGGSFAGDSNFTFNSSTNGLTVTSISSSLTELSDRSPYLISSGAIKLSTGSNGAVTIGMNITDLETDSNNGSLDDLILISDNSDSGIQKNLSLSKVQDLVNTNTTYTAGTGLSLSSTEFNLDFSELTDMTGDIAGTTEFILQDGTTESRKAASEIKLSAFNNDSGFTTNSGDITAVTAGTGLTGGGSSGGVTLDIDNSVIATLSGSSFSGPINFHNNAITGSEILDVSDNKLISLNSAVVINDDSGDHDFRIESNDNQGMFLIDAGTNQILLNNHPSTTRAAHEFLNDQASGGLGNDTGIYLSGSRGAIGTSTKGVTTIVGDLVVSGNIFQDDLGYTNNIYLETNLISTYVIYGRDRASPFNGGRDTNTSITFDPDEIIFQAGGIEMLTLDEATADNVIVNTNGVDVNFRVETSNLQAAIYSDGGTDQVVLGGNSNNISNYLLGTDTNILLSGTIGSKGTSTKGTAVASGDFVVSGTFHNPGIVHVFAYAGGITNITADTYSPIAFNTETTDTHNAFANSRFTAPYDGYYLINTMVMLNRIDTAADGYRLFVTGSSDVIPRAVMLSSFDPDELFPSGDTGAAGVTDSNTMNGSTTVYMPENSTLQVFVYQNGGANQTTANRVIGGLGVDGTHVTITKIG